jgi:hypothetical protein
MQIPCHTQPKLNTPPKLGTKRKNPIQGDAGYFNEELLFGGRIIPMDKKLAFEVEEYYSTLAESFSISDEWMSVFANTLRNKNFEKKNFFTPQTALTDLVVSSQS